MLSDDTQCRNRSLDLISNSRYYQPYNSYNVSSENLVLDQLIIHLIIFFFIIPILKSLVVPVIWLALIGAIYSRIATFFALNRIFLPANEATLKTKQPIRFQGFFKVINQIARKWKKKSIMWQILQLLFTKRLFPPPPKKKKNEWIFNFKPAQYCISKIFELTKSCIWAISKWM